MAPSRPTTAIGLAGVAGGLQGALGANLPLRLADGSGPGAELSIGEIGAIVGGLGLLSLAAVVGLFAAGYVWGGRAAYPSDLGRFGRSLLGAAVVGFGVGYLAIVIALGQPVGREQAWGSTVYRAVEAANGLVRVPIAGMAGGAFARYLGGRDAGRRHRAGSGFTGRFDGAIGLAGLAGLLQGLERNLPFIAADRGLTFLQTGATMGAISLASLGVTLGLFVVGYWWAIQADVPAAFGRFAGWLLVASLGGLAVGMLPFVAVDGSLVGAVVGFGLLSLSLLFVPLSGLAGAAMARSRAFTRPA